MLITRRSLILSASAAGLVTGLGSIVRANGLDHAHGDKYGPVENCDPKKPDMTGQPSECRLGYYRFDHDQMHAEYQLVFPQSGCNCATGQCRPTKWQYADGGVTQANPTGIEIYIDGGWFPVSATVLRRFYDLQKMTPDNYKKLRRFWNYEAHVCANQVSAANMVPTIECAWIRQSA